MSKKCRAFSDSKLGLEQPNNREAFYAGWDAALRTALAEPEQEPVAWRELCRRLYVELFHCDQQMMETLDEEGDPMWVQGAVVRDVLADAKAALESAPAEAAPTPRKPLTDEQIWQLATDCTIGGDLHADKFARAVIAAYEAKQGERT